MRRVTRVVLVGRDAALWLSAVALQRVMAPTGVRVETIELPSLLAPADIYTAVPALGALHRLIGLGEADVLRVCAGIPVLGQRFTGWSGGESGFVHGYDLGQPGIDDIDFLQFWVRARDHGMTVAWEDFSFAASAAREGRLSPANAEPDAPGTLSPGYHLHARAYAGAMRNFALSLGVAHRAVQRVEVDAVGTRIAALRLDDGSRVEADLFIDASGDAAALLGALPGAEPESWAGWLPCDRILRATAPALSPLPAYGQITAFRAGWAGLFPLQNRTALVATYSSAETGDADAAAALAAIAGTQPRDAVLSSFAAQGRTPWIGNCIGIGGAAASLEPLDAIALHLIHSGISHLLARFPADAGAMPEAAAYNRAMQASIANVRDFQIAHYRLNARSGEPLWDRVRAASGPESLETKLRLFAARGMVPLHDEESFQAQNWAASFVGHGLIPRGYDPRVDLMPEREQIVRFHALLAHIAEGVRAMPTVAQYLAGPSAG